MISWLNILNLRGKLSLCFFIIRILGFLSGYKTEMIQSWPFNAVTNQYSLSFQYINEEKYSWYETIDPPTETNFTEENIFYLF